MKAHVAALAYPHELVHHLAARALGLRSRIEAGAAIVDFETDAQEIVIALAPLACTIVAIAGAFALISEQPASWVVVAIFVWLSAYYLVGCAHDVMRVAKLLSK